MALKQILNSSPETPYSRPPPVHITVLEVKENVKVLSWIFEDTEARPSVSKKNVTAIISDGDSVSKIVIFEAFASKIKLGQAYVMKGYSLRGQSPPYWITVTKDTVFYRSAPVEVSAALKEEALKLLCPASPLTPLSEARRAEGLITINGEVVEIFTLKRTQVGRDTVPLRSVAVKEDQTQVTLNLWREAAVFPLQVGAQIRLTHLKGKESSHGFQLQSTTYTALEDTMETVVVSALGVTELDGKPGVLQLLVEGGKMFEIEEAVWLPLEPEMKKLPFFIQLTVSGKFVRAAEVSSEKGVEVKPM